LIAQVFSFPLLSADQTFQFCDCLGFNFQSISLRFPFHFDSKNPCKCPLLVSLTFKKDLFSNIHLNHNNTELVFELKVSVKVDPIVDGKERVKLKLEQLQTFEVCLIRIRNRTQRASK
jgi:hypothetical protein